MNLKPAELPKYIKAIKELTQFPTLGKGIFLIRMCDLNWLRKEKNLKNIIIKTKNIDDLVESSKNAPKYKQFISGVPLDILSECDGLEIEWRGNRVRAW